MSTTNTDTRGEIDKLTQTLAKVRDEHKAEKAAMLGPIRQALGLGDDAGTDAILAALTSRTPDAEALVTQRTAALTKERDTAVAAADAIKTERNAEKIDAALNAAFDKSGAKPEHRPDFLLLAKALFTVDAKGRVVTRDDAADTLPGVEPAAWIVGQLRASRPHYWPTSTGGGASGGGAHGAPLGDTSCFDPRSPRFNMSDQMRYERKWGREAADRAIRMYGGGRR